MLMSLVDSGKFFPSWQIPDGFLSKTRFPNSSSVPITGGYYEGQLTQGPVFCFLIPDGG